ncbi:MAG: DUF5060 domain-containing protein [Bacteroidales bacterium]
MNYAHSIFSKINKEMGLLCIALFFTSCQTTIVDIEHLTPTAAQYEKNEWQVKLKFPFSNPYDADEIALDMHFISPSGQHLVQPCFYYAGDGNKISIWKARFAARESGRYTYWFTLKRNAKEIATSKQKELSIKPSNKKGFLSINNLWTLKYDNGELFRGIGENFCWESRDEDDSKYFKELHENKRFNYRDMLIKLAQNKGNFFRTWMIYWNLPIDWKMVKNNSRYQNSNNFFNESAMERMDWLVDFCDSLGIHMMLALESHVGYMGIGWEISKYNAANGGPAKTPYEFFTSTEARRQYKNKLRLMVARYGYSPSIAMWEFFNEIDNVMYHGNPNEHIPDSVITDWHNDMSSYLKNIDPYKRIITTSISHRDVKGLNDLPHIDINQRHIYKNTDAIPELINEYTQKHQKPYIIGEFGYEWDWSKNFDEFKEEMIQDYIKGLWYGLFSPTPVLPMTWWWEWFDDKGMMHYFKHIQTIHQEMLLAGNGNNSSVASPIVNAKKTLAVQCGEKTFVYVQLSSPLHEIKLIFNNPALYEQKIYAYNTHNGSYFSVRKKMINTKMFEATVWFDSQVDQLILICE